MKSGVGVMQYASGNRYEGEWAQDAKSGYGVMEWKTLNQRYEGQWARNKPNGLWQCILKLIVTSLVTELEATLSCDCKSGYGVLEWMLPNQRNERQWAQKPSRRISGRFKLFLNMICKLLTMQSRTI